MDSNFLKQTSKDYDIPYNIVKYIYCHHLKSFHDRLEAYLKDRKDEN